MTVLPDLEHALVAAAGRRRRRRPPPRVVAAVAVAASAAVTLSVVSLSSSPRGTASPARESTQTPQPAPAAGTASARRAALAETYAVFDRPRRSVDRIPDSAAGPRRARPGPGVRMDLSQSRRVAVLGDVRAYAAPGTVGGRLAVCTFVVLRGGAGGAGCSNFKPAQAARRPPGSLTTSRPGTVYFLLLPDAVRWATLVLRDGGRRLTVPVADNGVLLRPASGARQAEWRLADGTLATVKYFEDPGDDTD